LVGCAYYNEIAPYPAEWLRNLIAAGLIAPGKVDERSIHDLTGEDLTGVVQFHAFAGIGGWSYALRLAGWPDDVPVWTGSCPCQPFSSAGKRKGTADSRHLWPEFRRLIAECLPPVIFGEQVASSSGREWLAGVRVDLEALGYRVGAADLCAAGVGAPHIRQRLYWVADRDGNDVWGQLGGAGKASGEGGRTGRVFWTGGDVGDCGAEDVPSNESRCTSEGLEYADSAGCATAIRDGAIRSRAFSEGGVWGRNWMYCADRTTRRIEPGLYPLAYGIPHRMDDLRSWLPFLDDVTEDSKEDVGKRLMREARQFYKGVLAGMGNSIVPQVAAVFIRAYMEARNYCSGVRA